MTMDESSNGIVAVARPRDLVASLTYTVDDGVTPWLYTRPVTADDRHSTAMGGAMEAVEVKIKDGRCRGNTFALDRHSFQLVSQQTTLATDDFYHNPNGIVERIYYREMEHLIRDRSGATKVVAYMHVVRNEAKKASGQDGVRGYSRGIHVDYAPSWAEQQYLEVLGQLRQETTREHADEEWTTYARGRFAVVTAWRNISPRPIQQDGLAVCDESSLVKPDDYLPGDFFLENNQVKKTYRLASRNASKHSWYYFPSMAGDEVLLMKQFDSDTTRAGRMCFHTAFTDPTAPPADQLSPRESIEVRAVAFFPRHSPNSCPIAPVP
jgi:hypothetical protein